MSVPPKIPQQWACSECDWRHHILIKSDVLIPAPQECPKCGGKLVLKPVSVLGAFLSLFHRG